ncbi:Purine nucleotide synthesis repressor [Pantoea agglomerans]|uniref:Purine nucleotide synthesis repressor n=1 Tax=Enterobacter agglomerans TaxID=549 RepID=A0A379AGS6_ENTAG|nr:Purine nucleotide synthesis repressor [Pantoea agglomerans]
MATIKDVAKRAGVSTTTVSHVINKTRFVAEETRNAVWQAIKELHYSPSAVGAQPESEPHQDAGPACHLQRSTLFR